MKYKTIAAAALITLGMAGMANAQTVMKISYSTAITSHYGVGSVAFCDEVEKGTQGRYKCQQFPFKTIVPFCEMCFSKLLICSNRSSQNCGVISSTFSIPGKFSFIIYSGCTRVTKTFS